MPEEPVVIAKQSPVDRAIDLMIGTLTFK